MFLALLGTSAFEGSVFNWCHDHRVHHRYTDTPKDPYNIKRGFFYAHMGWLINNRGPEVGTSDISDLKKDPFLRFQHEYYPYLALLLGFFVPMSIAGLFWGDWKVTNAPEWSRSIVSNSEYSQGSSLLCMCMYIYMYVCVLRKQGGLLIGGVASKVLLMQCTFFINSLAHYSGSATFTDKRTPRDSYLVSLLTFGEGYHKYTIPPPPIPYLGSLTLIMLFLSTASTMSSRTTIATECVCGTTIQASGSSTSSAGLVLPTTCSGSLQSCLKKESLRWNKRYVILPPPKQIYIRGRVVCTERLSSLRLIIQIVLTDARRKEVPLRLGGAS